MLAAPDAPDLLSIPSWEYGKIPRFSEAVKALFEDLTPYVKGAAVEAYPMLATYPTAAWRESIWNDAIYAVPNDTSLAIGWMLFARKDLLDKAGQQMPQPRAASLRAKAMTSRRQVWRSTVLPRSDVNRRRVEGGGGSGEKDTSSSREHRVPQGARGHDADYKAARAPEIVQQGRGLIGALRRRRG